MALHEPFGHLQHKLWLKEGPGLKLVVWLSTTKSQELTWSQCVHVECNIPLESSQGKLQVALDLVPIGGWDKKLWTSKVPGVYRDNFGTSFWESREKVPFGCKCGGEAQKILYGGRWWLPPSSGRGESSESMLPVACPSTKVL
jgi:hypothetical protein